MPNNTLAAASVAENELKQVEQLVQDLPQGSSLAVMLQNIVDAASRGVDISLFTSERDLTPNEVADLLRMSRNHLVKLMDQDVIAFHMVGSHRRVRMDDLMDFIERQERARAFVAHAVGTTAHTQQVVRDEAAQFTPEELAELGLPS